MRLGVAGNLVLRSKFGSDVTTEYGTVELLIMCFVKSTLNIK